MTTIKNFSLFLTLLFVATCFAPNALQAQTRVDSSFVFSAGDPGQWNVAKLRYPLADGRHVMATHKTKNTQVVIAVRSRKIAAVGTMVPGGTFKVLSPSTAAPCRPNISCATFQLKHCFVIDGQCFCVCGAWITSYPN